MQQGSTCTALLSEECICSVFRDPPGTGNSCSKNCPDEVSPNRDRDLDRRSRNWHVLKFFHARRAYWHDRSVIVLASRSDTVHRSCYSIDTVHRAKLGNGTGPRWVSWNWPEWSSRNWPACNWRNWPGCLARTGPSGLLGAGLPQAEVPVRRFTWTK